MADLADLLSRPVLEVAPRLLGGLLRRGEVTLRISEVEAYAGGDDPGSHAYRGPTPRTEIMFGPPGRLYCYLSYGVHVCANVTVGPVGTASAVLLRAGEVTSGISVARTRRPGAVDRDLARGPARLCRSVGIELSDNGTDLGSGPVTLTLAAPPPAAFRAGPRVGLTEAPDRPWRFWISDDPTVSPYRRSPRAASPDG